MKVSKLVSSIILFVFFGTAVDAQFQMPKVDKVVEMKNRQLIVIINVPDPSLVEKYSRKNNGEIAEEYKQVFGNYNEEMKYIAQKFWNFNSKEILFKTWAEMKDIMRDKSQQDKYIVMYCFSDDNHKGFEWRINGDGNKIVGTRSYFAVCFPDENPLVHYHLAFSNLIPTVTDLVNAISSTNSEFNYMVRHQDKPDMRVMVQENAHILAGKTLLILKSSVPEKMVANISTWYPCSYRLVEDSVMDQEVLSADSACAYVITCRTAAGDYLNWLVNCADGAVIGYTDKGTQMTESVFEPGLRNDFFKEIANICAGQKGMR